MTGLRANRLYPRQQQESDRHGSITAPRQAGRRAGPPFAVSDAYLRVTMTAREPIFADDGRVAHILHRAEDATEVVRLKREELDGQPRELLIPERFR